MFFGLHYQPDSIYIYVYVSVYINKYNNTSYQHIWDSHCICNRSLSPSTIASIIGSAFLNISEYFCSSAGHWRQEHRPGVGPGAPHRSGEARRCRCQDQVPGGRGNVWVKCGGRRAICCAGIAVMVEIYNYIYIIHGGGNMCEQ